MLAVYVAVTVVAAIAYAFAAVPGPAMPWNRSSMAMPSEVESPTPNRQKSVPTQVLTVRKLFP